MDFRVFALLTHAFGLSLFSKHIWLTESYRSATYYDLSNIILQSTVTELYLSVWVKLDVLPNSSQTLCSVTHNSTDSIVIEKLPTSYQIRATKYSPTPLIADVLGATDAFKWEFIALSAKGSAILLCSSVFSSSLTCSETPLEVSFSYLVSDLRVDVGSDSAGFLGELYDFQIQTVSHDKDTIVGYFTAYSCNLNCQSCHGPTLTACDEFLSLILDTEQIQVSDLSGPYQVQGSSPRFQGRSLQNTSAISITLWYKPYADPTYKQANIFALRTADCSKCDTSMSQYGCRILFSSLDLSTNPKSISLQYEGLVPSSGVCNHWAYASFVRPR